MKGLVQSQEEVRSFMDGTRTKIKMQIEGIDIAKFRIVFEDDICKKLKLVCGQWHTDEVIKPHYEIGEIIFVQEKWRILLQRWYSIYNEATIVIVYYDGQRKHLFDSEKESFIVNDKAYKKWMPASSLQEVASRIKMEIKKIDYLKENFRSYFLYHVDVTLDVTT